MKKVLAILLTAVMVLSLVACSTVENNDKSPDTTKPTQSGTINTAQKQEYYNSYFTSNDFKMAGESFKLSAEGMTISALRDSNGAQMVEMATAESFLKLYKVSDTEQYVHVKLPDEETGTAEVWFKYEDANTPDVITSAETVTEVDSVDVENITKVEYVETKNGCDIVKVYVPNEEYDATQTITEYIIEFTYEGQACTMTITEYESAESNMTHYDDDGVPEGFDSTDYVYDFENSIMTHEDDATQIEFTLVSTTDKSSAEENVVEMGIDSDTHMVKYYKMVIDNVPTTIEFMDVASVTDGMNIPEEIEVCDAEMLSMLLLAFMLSGMPQ